MEQATPSPSPSGSPLFSNFSSNSVVAHADAAGAKKTVAVMNNTSVSKHEEERVLLLNKDKKVESNSSRSNSSSSSSSGINNINKNKDDDSKSKSSLSKSKLSSSDKHALRRLWKETIPHEKGYMGAGVVAMLVSSATNMAFPTVIGRILDRTTRAAAAREGKAEGGGDGGKEGEMASLRLFMGRAVLIFVCGAVGSCVRTHCLRMAKEGTARRLRKKLLHSLLRQEKAFFDDPEQGGHRTGEMVAILEGDVEASSEVFTTRLADGLRSTSSALNGTAMLLRLSPKLTAVSLGLVPVFTLAIVANVVLTRALTARQRALAAAATGFAQERLGNLGTVHAFTAEARDEAAYAALLDEAHGLAAQVSLAKGFFMGGLFFAGSVTMTAVLSLGGSLAGKGEMSVGDLTSFSMYTGLVALGFSGLSSYASDTWKSAVAARRVFDLLDQDPSSFLSSSTSSLPASPPPYPSISAKGHLRFQQVTFAYPNRPSVPVLKGVDLEILPGQVAAIVGASGAGKSTLLALLLRLYDLEKGVGGKVWMDGEEVGAVDPRWVREQVGLVEQEPVSLRGEGGREGLREGEGGRESLSCCL